MTAEANSMLVGCYGLKGTRTLTKPSGTTERYQKGAAGIPTLSILGADKAVGAGATGNMVATAAGGTMSLDWVAQLVALRTAPVHTVQFATSGLAASTSVSVAYAGTDPANNALSGSNVFSSPGPGTAIATRPGTSFTFAFPTIAGYSLESTSQTGPITTGADGGSTTVTATYLALSSPMVTTQPGDQAVTYGSDAEFSAAASGNPAPTLLWQERTNSTSPWTDIPGATTTPLTVARPPVSMTEHQYRAVYTSSQGTTPSNPATLTVNPRPITVTADLQSKVHDAPDPALTYNVTSGTLVGTDAFTGALTREAGEDVGDYDILQGSLALGDNYALTFVPGVFSITPATLTVTPDTYTTAEDTLLVVDAPGVLANDTSHWPPSAALAAQASNGTVVLNANGSFTYTPADNYHGSDSFTYTVTAGTVTSAPATVSITVTAVNDPPTANFTFSPAAPTTLEGVTFTDTSTDVDGTIVGWSWEFGDGTTSSAQSPPAHTYAAAGDYAMNLTVTDNDGGHANDTATVTVTDVPPVAAFTASTSSGSAPLTVTFTDASSGVVNTRLWDFGDGATSTGPSPSHVYTAAGTYTVNLTVTNTGGSDSTTRTVRVAPRPWIAANFTADATTGAAPLTVRFTDCSIGTIYYWGWEFGDGATSTEQNPVHTYTTAGAYTVRLLVGDFVTTDRHDLTVTVTETALTPLVANFTANATSGTAPLAVRFTDTSTGDGIDGRWWYFGDGGSSTGQDPVHVYAAPGTYAVTLIVTNAGGGLDSEVKTGHISVLPDLPPIGGDKGYFLVSTAPSGADIFLEDISATRYLMGNTTDGPLNVSIYLTATPMRKIIANLTGYHDAVFDITQYPASGETVPVNLTLEPIATPTPTSTSTPTPEVSGPYPGPHALPAVIQAEDYDSGGEGAAYHDLDPENLGGAYRTAEGVDIEIVNGVTNVGWIRAGEYLKYSVDASAAGSFTLTLHASNPDATPKTVAVSLDGSPASQVVIGPTGGWTAYQDFVTVNSLDIPAGRHVVTLSFEGISRFNLDWLNLGDRPTPTVTTTTDAPSSGAATFVAAPLTASKGTAVRFALTPSAGKTVKEAWWSFDAPAHLKTWNSRAVNPTFYYPAKGTFSPLVKITYTDGSTETVQRANYITAT